MTRAEANRLLDWVRAGGEVPESEVMFALWITGDLLAGGRRCMTDSERQAPGFSPGSERLMPQASQGLK